MKREQIKQILIDNFNTWGYTQEFFDLSADAILALPLDVPSDEEIEKYCYKENHGNTRMGAKWMREEIIKRNK